MKTIPYGEEEKNNELIFIELTKQIRPDIWVIMDLIDKTGVSPTVLVHIIRELNKVNLGTGWGGVRIEINNRIATRIFSDQNEKLDEPLLKA